MTSGGAGKRGRVRRLASRWFRLLRRLYPRDFRDEMGDDLVDSYRERADEAMRRAGLVGLVGVCLRALVDSLRNGLGERLRPAVSWRRGGDWGRDIERVARRLRRAPTLLLSTTATLGVGLGLAAVVYTVVQRVLIDPMPYKDPGDLYYVWRDYSAMADLRRGMVAGTDIVELQRAGGPIEAVTGLGRQLHTFAMNKDAEPIEIAVMFTSPGLFDLLGVSPARGRGFLPDEIGPAATVVVLTHELWTRLGADRGVLGREVRLNNRPYRVVGVLPRGFTFARSEASGPPQSAEAFIPFRTRLEESRPREGAYAALLRARRGTPAAEVAAAVGAVGRAIDARDFQGKGLRLYAVGLKPDLVSGVRPALVALAACGLFLAAALLVNLASVLLARAAQRERELAVSRTLGASGAAILRATLIEGTWLGLLGGSVAALGAYWGTQVLVALAPLDLPRREAIAVDARIAAVVIAAGGLIGLLAAVAPATWAARVSLSSLLARSAVHGGGGHGRLRRGMVVTQVALSFVLLVAGGLVVRSFERLLRVDPGFRPEGVLSLWVRMPPEFVPRWDEVGALQDRIEEELAALPGVTGVSATSALPLCPRPLPAFHAASAFQMRVTFPGAPGNTGEPERDTPLVDIMGVRRTFVEVMGLRVLEGRSFDTPRRDGKEALIDAALARQFFPAGRPLGAELRLGNDAFTVVGVVQHVRLQDVHQDGRPQVILRGPGTRRLAWVVRTERDPKSLVPDVRTVISRIDARLVAADIQPMEALVGRALQRHHISAVLLAAFAVGALLLAAMGLYGVVAGAVLRRRHELALRLVVGADHRALMRLVLREGASLVLLGVLFGAPGLYVAARLIRGVLVGITPLDPLTLLSVAAGLGLVALLACYVPARRVLGIDPLPLLRAE